MLKRLQSPRMFELGDCASITKLRRASKMEFDVHGMVASINMLLIRSLSDFVGRRSFPAAQLMDEFVAPPNVCFWPQSTNAANEPRCCGKRTIIPLVFCEPPLEALLATAAR